MSPVVYTSAAYLALVVVCLLALGRRGKFESIILRVENSFARLAARPWLAGFSLFGAVLILRLGFLWLLPAPTPLAHDEFSYLLLGDTFAHGRLTNPTPPLWKSFETFHVNLVPTYCSKYPPAQGLILAIGELIWTPWFGVLLSAAFMAAIVYWSLRAWMPKRWAYLAGALVLLRLCITTYWVNSFWGGAAAAIGGALALGGLARILRKPSTGSAIALGIGISILANSRPFEGAFFCIPVGAVFLWWLAGKTRVAPPLRERLPRVALPLAAILLANFIFMGYYNWRTTGSITTMPVVLYEKRYSPDAIFIWQKPKPPFPHSNKEFDEFFNGWQWNLYKGTWRDFVATEVKKLRYVFNAHKWTDLLWVTPGFLFLFRHRKMYLPLAAFASTMLGFGLVAWSLPHYFAPATCVFYAVFVTAMRYVRLFRPKGIAIGIALCRLAVLGLALETADRIATGTEDQGELGGDRLPGRPAVLETLSGIRGKHLIVVRYSKSHIIFTDWVYNPADLEGSKVIWARELDDEQNRKLVEHFKDRRVWLLQPDRAGAPLLPYALAGPRAGAAAFSSSAAK
jgi:hypothetical protein